MGLDYKVETLQDSLKNEIVYTPFSPALQNNVHYVDDDHHVMVNEGNIEIIQTRTGAIRNSYSSKSVESDLKYLLKSENYNTHQDLKSQDGWITHAECEIFIPNPKPTYFSTEWIVPSNPVNNSHQLIYLFVGLGGVDLRIDGNSKAYILQPVLQWGESPAGGGKYWATCNWFVSNENQFFHDSLIRVNPGDKLQGIIRLIANSDSLYCYNSSFIGYSEGLNVYNISRLERGYLALETYNIKNCNEYPADEKIRMFNIKMMTDTVFPPIVWHIYNQIDNCGQFTNVIDESPNNGEVNIHFHKPYSAEGFEDVYIYPNPVLNNVHFSITRPVYYCRIEVYNNLGKLIHTENHKTLAYEYYLDFQNFSPGMYFIKLYYQSNLITRETNHVFKVIKVRN